MAEKVDLLVGPFGDLKLEQLVDTYRASSSGSQVSQKLWIVPDLRSVGFVRRLLMASAENTILGPNVQTFGSLAEWVISSSSRRVRSLTKVQKLRLLQVVIDELLESESLVYFKAIARSPGFLTQVDELLADLKRRDIWPEQYTAAARSDRDQEFSKIYAVYQEKLHQGGLYDVEGRFWLAREVLNKPENQGRFQFEPIILHGFRDFTAAQYEILKLLEQSCRRLMISIDLDANVLQPQANEIFQNREQLFSKPRETVERLQEMWPQSSLLAVESSPATQPALGQLKSCLFVESEQMPAWQGSCEGLEIIAANSALDEIQEVAARIKERLLHSEARPEDILVLSPELGVVANRIGQVFQDYGIPHVVEHPRRLETSPLLRTLCQLLKLKRDDWPFRTALSVIGNRLIGLLDDDEQGDQTRIAVESCLRAAQLPEGKSRLVEQLQWWSQFRSSAVEEDPEVELPAHVVQAPLAVQKISELGNLLETLPAKAPLENWIQAVEVLLVEAKVLESTAESSSQEVREWFQLRRSLRSIVTLQRWTADTHSLTLSEFFDLLELLSRHESLPRERDSTGRVAVLSVESARHVPAKHLYLMGLGERAFEPREERDLSDVESATKETKSTLLNDPYDDARHLFYEILALASESLTLSYTAFDEKAQALLPCPMLEDVRRCFGSSEVPTTVKPIGPSTERQAKALSLQDFRRQAMERALEGKRDWLAEWATHPQLRRTGASILGGLTGVASRGNWHEYGPFEGLLESSLAQSTLAKRFDKQHLWSPSQLESYACCPYRFFAEQILGLQPLSELTLQSDAARRGSLLHQVLADLHEQLIESSATTESDVDLQKRFLKALNAIIEANPVAGLEDSLREIERREIESWAPLYVTQENTYRESWKDYDQPVQPKYFELRFGAPSFRGSTDKERDVSQPIPFELDLGEERIRLTGQIDRVDVGRVGGVTIFNIIDYKSGKADRKLELDKVTLGQQLQLPLYALAVERQLLSEEDARALSVGYWNVRSKGYERHKKATGFPIRELQGQTLTETQQWDDLMPKMLQRVKQIIGGIRQGEFPVYNQDEHCASYCPMSTICRIGQIRSMEKQWEIGVTTHGSE